MENRAITMPKMDQHDAMRTTIVGVGGTILSMTLERYSLIASAVAATGTALYMILKCIEIIAPKVVKFLDNRKKHRKETSHEEKHTDRLRPASRRRWLHRGPRNPG